MRAQRSLIIIALLLTTMWAAAQVTIPVQPVPPPANSVAGDIRINSPQDGEKLDQTFVTLKYQLLNPGATAQGLPTYNVQLDGDSLIETTSTSHTFTGLKPGVHTIMVELIDANGTPIPGSRKQVKFEVLPQQQPGPSGAAAMQKAAGTRVEPASYQQGSEPVQPGAMPQSGNDDQLPSSGTALPLLSVIGFGVLVGGIVSAMKTRH